MIENNEMGLKIAETEDEKFWFEIKQNTESDIKNIEKMLKFQKSVLEMCNSHLNL